MPQAPKISGHSQCCCPAHLRQLWRVLCDVAQGARRHPLQRQLGLLHTQHQERHGACERGTHIPVSGFSGCCGVLTVVNRDEALVTHIQGRHHFGQQLQPVSTRLHPRPAARALCCALPCSPGTSTPTPASRASPGKFSWRTSASDAVESGCLSWAEWALPAHGLHLAPARPP